MKNNIAKEKTSKNLNKDRLCVVYGCCGRDQEVKSAHAVTNFGLKKLNEIKK